MSQSQPEVISTETAPNVSQPASRAITPESRGCSDKLQPQPQIQKQSASKRQPQPSNEATHASQPAIKPTAAAKYNRPASVSEPQPRTQVRPQPAPETPKTPNFTKFVGLTDETYNSLMDLVAKIDNAKFRKDMAHDSKFKDKTAECTRNQKTVRPTFYLRPRKTHDHIHICPHPRDLTQTHANTRTLTSGAHPSQTHSSTRPLISRY